MSLFQEFMTFDSSYPRMAAMIYMVSSIVFTGAARGVAKAWEGKGGGATKALHSTMEAVMVAAAISSFSSCLLLASRCDHAP